jgi:hypothetical protein
MLRFDPLRLTRERLEGALAEARADALANTQARRATRQRGASGIRVNPENEVARERHERQRAYQSSHAQRHGRQVQAPQTAAGPPQVDLEGV